MIEKDLKVLPIEVKSGKDYKRHSTLTNMTSNNIFDEAMILYGGNIEKKGSITYYPIYMTMFIEERHLPEEFPEIDLDILNKIGK